MKTLRLQRVLLLLILSSCVQTQHEGGNAPSQKARAVLFNQAMGEAIGSKILLTEIREGRISNALESLEISIDSSVVIMGRAINQSDETQREILQALRMVKAYRQQYPREPKALVHDDEELRESAKEAQRILESIK